MAPEQEMAEYKETLRRLALNDECFVESVLGMGRDTVEVSRLDQKTHALVRLGASLAIDAAPSSYQANVEVALAAGASIDEIVGTLIAVAPTVGLARVVSAAPELALALGYDVDAALETPKRGSGLKAMSTARVPHRVGRRRLRRLVEHRSTRPGSTAPRSVLEPVAPSGATGAVSPPTRPVQEAAVDADGAQALAERLHRAERGRP